MHPFDSLILAAGKGVRMKSNLPKVLHPVLGKPMVQYVIETVQRAGTAKTHVIIGFGKDQMRQTLSRHGVGFVEQNEQLGTGHAVQCFAREHPTPPEHLLVVCGDTPLLSEATLKTMIEQHFTVQPAATMITLDMQEPGGYGRIIRNRQGDVVEIREAKDCSEDEKRINEVNLAIYIFRGKDLYDRLFKLKNDNRQKEYYLTDVIGMLTQDGLKVIAVKERDEASTLGINSRIDLNRVADILRRRVIEKHLTEGVSILDPATTWIESDVVIGPETVIHPHTTLTGRTIIGSRCRIGPQIRISDAVVEDGVQAEFSVIEHTTVTANTRVRPFSHLCAEQAPVGAGE